MRDYKAICMQYVSDITSGKITAGVYTKKAIQRFKNDLKRSQDEDFLYFMDWDAVSMVCSFAESLKPSDLNGNTITLLSWQVFCFANLEGWRFKAE
ncbi:MAG: terminase large subunit, partial [archaeon]|nr:terminase large subunit [archaeon]